MPKKVRKYTPYCGNLQQKTKIIRFFCTTYRTATQIISAIGNPYRKLLSAVAKPSTA